MLRGHKEKRVIAKLTRRPGRQMAKMRKVTVVARLCLRGANHAEVEETTGTGQDKTGTKRSWLSSAPSSLRTGSQADAPALHARRSARGRLHRRPGAAGVFPSACSFWAAAYRPGNGHGVPPAGRAWTWSMMDGLMQGADRDLVRSGEDERQPLRQHPAQDKTVGAQATPEGIR